MKKSKNPVFEKKMRKKSTFKPKNTCIFPKVEKMSKKSILGKNEQKSILAPGAK